MPCMPSACTRSSTRRVEMPCTYAFFYWTFTRRELEHPLRDPLLDIDPFTPLITPWGERLGA